MGGTGVLLLVPVVAPPPPPPAPPKRSSADVAAAAAAGARPLAEDSPAGEAWAVVSHSSKIQKKKHWNLRLWANLSIRWEGGGGGGALEKNGRGTSRAPKKRNKTINGKTHSHAVACCLVFDLNYRSNLCLVSSNIRTSPTHGVGISYLWENADHSPKREVLQIASNQLPHNTVPCSPVENVVNQLRCAAAQGRELHRRQVQVAENLAEVRLRIVEHLHPQQRAQQAERQKGKT